MQPTKLVVAGKNNIAVDVLQNVIDSGMLAKEEIAVICNRTETGKNGWQKSLRWYANKWGIAEISLEDAYGVENLLFLSLEYDRIIRPSRFNTERIYNIHFSALPKHKGMYTSVWPILERDQEAGVTLHRIDSGIDTGEIIDSVLFSLNGEETARDLYLQYISYGTELILKWLPRLLSTKSVLSGRKQQGNFASYHAQAEFDFTQTTLNLNKTAVEICTQLRALSFREYQLPQVNNRQVVWGKITNISSQEKTGKMIWQDEYRGIFATVDYDVVLYWDMLEKALGLAAMGDVVALQQIPCLECYVNQSVDAGFTPLMAACKGGHYDCFMLLATLSADLAQTDWEGRSLLHYAHMGWRKQGERRIMEYLMKCGMELDSENYDDPKIKSSQTLI